MPVLKYLIWRPVWAEKECDMLPGGDFDDMVQNYRENMFDLHQELRVFAYVLPGDRYLDRKSTRLNSSHSGESRMPSSA